MSFIYKLWILVTLALPIADVVDSQQYGMESFDLSAPPGEEWEMMVKGMESIWFRRVLSFNEFATIGVMAVRGIEKDRWSLSDQELAHAVIKDYRQSTLESGHVITDEKFETLTIDGKRFFADTALLPAIHGLPVDSDYTAHELVYVHILPRPPASRPSLFVFLFTDVHQRGIDFKNELKEFEFVLKSFKPKPLRNPTGF